MSTPDTRGYRRIATEEAYAPAELLEEYRELLRTGGGDIGFESLWSYYLLNDDPQPTFLRDRIQDLGEQRIADMDRLGIDHQVLSLTTPGVELLEPARARELATLANDRIADACRRYPDRFTGLAAVYLQDVDFAVAELRRAVTELGLRGLIVNSHAGGEYLDAPRFEPLLAVAAELGVPIYLHPNTPSDAMIAPLREAGLDGAIFGFGVETGMHLVRIIFSGVFDRHPDLRLVVGHLGEAIPFWQFRIDHFHAIQQRAARYPGRPHLRRAPSDYLRSNIWITTSGMAWGPAIEFVREVVGSGRVIYAMDYPYQAVASEIEVQEHLRMTPGQRRHFFEDGARELFGIAG